MARGDKGPQTKEVVIIHKCFIKGEFVKPSEDPNDPEVLELPIHDANLLINDKRAVEKKNYQAHLEEQAEKAERRGRKSEPLKLGKKSGKKSGKPSAGESGSEE